MLYLTCHLWIYFIAWDKKNIFIQIIYILLIIILCCFILVLTLVNCFFIIQKNVKRMRFVCKIKMLIWLYSLLVLSIMSCVYLMCFTWGTCGRPGNKFEFNFTITFGNSFEVCCLSDCLWSLPTKRVRPVAPSGWGHHLWLWKHLRCHLYPFASASFHCSYPINIRCKYQCPSEGNHAAAATTHTSDL